MSLDKETLAARWQAFIWGLSHMKGKCSDEEYESRLLAMLICLAEYIKERDKNDFNGDGT